MKVAKLHTTCVSNNCIKVEAGRGVQCKDNVICGFNDKLHSHSCA